MESFPPLILGRIVEIIEARVDEEFRSSHRFLSHLPLTSVVMFCKIILMPPIFLKQTLKFFSGMSIWFVWIL